MLDPDPDYLKHVVFREVDYFVTVSQSNAIFFRNGQQLDRCDWYIDVYVRNTGWRKIFGRYEQITRLTLEYPLTKQWVNDDDILSAVRKAYRKQFDIPSIVFDTIKPAEIDEDFTEFVPISPDGKKQ